MVVKPGPLLEERVVHTLSMDVEPPQVKWLTPYPVLSEMPKAIHFEIWLPALERKRLQRVPCPLFCKQTCMF